MIPEVTDFTIESTLATLYEDRDYSKKTLKHIKKTNPALYSLVEIVVNEKDEDYAKGYTVGFLQMYTLISRQMESDIMEKVFE